MLCVWWEKKGIIYYELLETGYTVNATRNSQELKCLNEEIKKGHDYVMGIEGFYDFLLHLNGRSHDA